MGASDDDDRARDDEYPAHAVSLDGYWIDKTEVSNAQFAAFLNAHGNSGADGHPMAVFGRGYIQIVEEDGAYTVGSAADRPVVMVTWYGAQAYCDWAGGRLPTEAEWEYAARGPANRLYPWGKDAPHCALARFGDCPRVATAVGSLPDGASWCGALDMAGNVWEWVADWYAMYPAGACENPTGPTTGEYPVQRGGGWHSPWWELRATYRQHDTARASCNG
jgi:serine/threonine-protein kinase